MSSLAARPGSWATSRATRHWETWSPFSRASARASSSAPPLSRRRSSTRWDAATAGPVGVAHRVGHATRTAGLDAARAGPVEQGDRPRTLDRRGHRQEPRPQPARQASRVHASGSRGRAAPDAASGVRAVDLAARHLTALPSPPVRVWSCSCTSVYRNSSGAGDSWSAFEWTHL